MTDDMVLRAGVLKAISDFTKARYDEARAELAKTMNRGDRLMALSPIDDVKLGAVYMTDPEPRCRIVDETALTEWMVEHYPAATEGGYEVIGSEKEVVDVLFQHAPHLLRKVRRVSPDQLRELRANAVALGVPIGPGGEADIPGLEVDAPDPVVACKPAETAWQAVVDLHRAGRLELDGTVRPAIEGAA